MIGPDAALQLMHSYGLLLLAPVAILEGPIVTVIAGYLAHLGVFSVYAAYIIVVLADLVGDAALYALGRGGINWLSPKWRDRLGLNEKRLSYLGDHFRDEGGRTLVVAKLTHSLGVVALVAAGVSHMRMLPFLWYNLLATLPKSLFFLIIGYSLGYAYRQVNSYIFWLSLVPLVLFFIFGIHWYLRRKVKE